MESLTGSHGKKRQKILGNANKSLCRAEIRVIVTSENTIARNNVVRLHYCVCGIDRRIIAETM